MKKNRYGEVLSMNIVLFDGVCNLCNNVVQFLINRDPKDQFRFASLQSDIAEELLQKHNQEVSLNSFVLIKNDKVYTKSTAALHICKNLPGWWKCLFIFIIIPKFIRDPLYNLIANNRYKWFGKKK
ncbi:thiol-disulfide oxidoreductase DCC family protein [Bacillaceae bacterium W0354]